MSRTVRRLILDHQVLWMLMELLLVAMMVTMDWGWLVSLRSTSVVQWFVPVFCIFCGMLFVPKMPAWQPLPIAASERRRALWWLWIGLPLIRAMVCMALPLVVVGALHRVHAKPAQIASLIEIQLAAIVPMGGIFAAGGVLRRRFGVGVPGVLVVLVFVLGVAFSGLKVAGPPALVWGALADLVLVGGSYVWTDRVAGGAAAGLSKLPEARQSAAARRGLRGWAVLAPYALSAMVLAVAAAVAIDYSMVLMVGDNLGETARRRLPAQMIMTVVLLSAIGGQAAPYALRALRALPLGPAALTAVLQGFMLALTIAPAGVLWLVMRATHLETSQVPLYLMGMIPIVALRLPINFRVGIQAGMFVTLVPMIGLMFLPFAAWAHSPWFNAAMVLCAGLVWIWTWWELACGRSAYRVAPLGVWRWRGGIN